MPQTDQLERLEATLFSDAVCLINVKFFRGKAKGLREENLASEAVRVLEQTLGKEVIDTPPRSGAERRQAAEILAAY